MTDDQTANDECGICLETLTAAVTLPCNHKFCASCLDGWKSKFGSSLKKERSKSCPLCREKIPPSKDLLIQLEFHRTRKRRCEAEGDTSSEIYMDQVKHIKELEDMIGDYEGEGLEYDDNMELPKEIFNALKSNDIRRIMRWLGSPVDIKRLNARDPDNINCTLVHLLLAIDTANSNLLSILLQFGANVNALNAGGFTPLMLATNADSDFEPAKILLECGAEISVPRSGHSNKDVFIRMMKDFGNTKLVNLISSEFGGRRCEVINLPNHPQLNGKACVVEKYIVKKDKYKIIFEGSGNAALVGPNNLKRRDRTPLDCGYYISFKNGRMSRRDFATKEECQAYVASLDSSSVDVKETAEELASLKV